jgi:membrane-bound ClpP family serine protease
MEAQDAAHWPLIAFHIRIRAMDPWVWAILLLILGSGLAVLEVFFPSAGILAFLSAAALLGAIVMGFKENPMTGVLILLAAVIGLPALIVAGFKYWPKTAMGRRVLLMAPSSADVMPDDPEKAFLTGLVGRVGRAKSKMLLSGVITIDGRTVDATSESMPIEVGQAVRVVQVRGREVVVRPIDESEAAPPADPLKRTYDDPFDSPPA